MTRKRDLRTRLRTPERERAALNFAQGFTSKFDEGIGSRTGVRIGANGSLEMLTKIPDSSLLDGLIGLVTATFANEGWEIPDQLPQNPMREIAPFRALASVLNTAPSGGTNDAAFAEQLKLAMIDELAAADAPENQARIVYSALLRARELQDSNPRRAIDYLSFAAWSIAELVMLLERQPRKDGMLNKLANDPTQGPKRAIYAAWKKWYPDRRKYPKPRDFRAAMLLQYPTVPDGTLKNWMSLWPQGKNLPS